MRPNPLRSGLRRLLSGNSSSFESQQSQQAQHSAALIHSKWLLSPPPFLGQPSLRAAHATQKRNTRSKRRKKLESILRSLMERTTATLKANF
ncbi:hypothetical protein L596_016752 [Steinernema carpocapsae]|uniref:Uncharacterized protein n=1 Tax=Steinernema carpocapsae TaxID=34508 RepID=A0A4U5NJS5_STECR|nr:hypothetical protein L596_016752 [Steinernema carpocapsae]